MEATIEDRIQIVKNQIAEAAAQAGRAATDITLCAATKVQDDKTIRAAIAAGVTVCGENRVQELNAHLENHSYTGAEVHFIGHLQRNKVKYVVGQVSLIQSVDGEELLRLINHQAEKIGVVQDFLVEVNIGEEETKSGVSPAEAHRLAALSSELSNVRLRGLMAIPPVAVKKGDNRSFFAAMYQLFVDIKEKMYNNKSCLDVLSMGMSGDFTDAILEGATLVRIGTAIFGPRPSNRIRG